MNLRVQGLSQLSNALYNGDYGVTCWAAVGEYSLIMCCVCVCVLTQARS